MYKYPLILSTLRHNVYLVEYYVFDNQKLTHRSFFHLATKNRHPKKVRTPLLGQKLHSVV